jgi:hypothetical protein
MRCNCVDVVKASLQAFYYDTSLNPYKGIAGRFRRLPQYHLPELPRRNAPDQSGIPQGKRGRHGFPSGKPRGSAFSSFHIFSFVARSIEAAGKLTDLITGGRLLWGPSLKVIARKK